MRKVERWTPEEASTIYWLVLWGLKDREVIELSKDVLKSRSLDALQYISGDIRKHITKMKKLPYSFKEPKTPIEIIRKASKIPPVKEIADLKPEDLEKVFFRPSGTKTFPNGKKINEHPNFEQRPEGYITEKKEIILPKHSVINKELSLKDVLDIAKTSGAKKVVWGDYIIKFR